MTHQNHSGFRPTGRFATVETKDGGDVDPKTAVSKIETPEIKAAFEHVLTTFEKFKEANDAEIKALKDGKSVDVLITEKTKAINEALSGFQTSVEALQKGEAERKERLDKLETVVRRTKTGYKEGEEGKAYVHAAQFKSLVENRRVRPTDDDVDLEFVVEYQKAFVALMEHNGQRDMLSVEQMKTLSVGQQGDGGFYVPPALADAMTVRIFETSPMRSIAGNITISTDAYEIMESAVKGTSGGWVGEKAARAATATPTLDKKRIEIFEQYAYPEATQQILEDAAVDLERWLMDMTQDEMVRTENAAFISGTGVNKPRGFLTYGADAVTTDDPSRAWGVVEYIPLGGTAGFGDDASIAGASDPDPLIDMVYATKAAYRQNANWVMRRLTAAIVRKLKDGNGQYIWAPGLTAGQPSLLLQYPVVEMEDMDAWSTNNFPIAFGDFRRAYLIVDRRGLSILRDPFTNKPLVGFYMTKRVGGDAVNLDAIKLGKAATS